MHTLLLNGVGGGSTQVPVAHLPFCTALQALTTSLHVGVGRDGFETAVQGPPAGASLTVAYAEQPESSWMHDPLASVLVLQAPVLQLVCESETFRLFAQVLVPEQAQPHEPAATSRPMNPSTTAAAAFAQEGGVAPLAAR
jgi:hypothetical protein